MIEAMTVAPPPMIAEVVVALVAAMIVTITAMAVEALVVVAMDVVMCTDLATATTAAG